MWKIQTYISILALIVVSSCKVQYSYIYVTDTEHRETDDYSICDSILNFTFFPRPNGIFFELENKTDKNIFLIWDGTYFIDPSNNTSKALNTDILATKEKIVSKENNESIIAKNGAFRRFTTSAKNVSVFRQIWTDVYTNRDSYIQVNSAYKEEFLHSPYWIAYTKTKYEDKYDLNKIHKAQMDTIQEFLSENNNLGLGFTFRVPDEKIECDFKFPIKKVLVYRKTSNDDTYEIVDTLNAIDNFYPHHQ